jgi:large subunit ribosomal protein L13
MPGDARSRGPFGRRPASFDAPTKPQVAWVVRPFRPASSRMKTYSPRPRDIERRWYVIDASGAVLGRLATEVAAVLRGKHKPIFATHMDTGDHVIVVNAKGVRLTGGKETRKFAYRHSGHPGGLTATPYDRLLERRPAFAVEKAIRGMLPKNRLGRAMVKKLQVYEGPEHPHAAQKPQALRLGEVPTWEGLPRTEEPAKAAATRPEPSKPATKRTTAGRATKPPAKKTTARRPAAKTTARSAAAKKTTAKKPTAKKITAKKTTTAKVKKTTAKRTTARRTRKGE